MKKKKIFLPLIALLLILSGCKEQKFHTKTQLFAVNNTSDTFLVKLFKSYERHSEYEAVKAKFDNSNIKKFELKPNDSTLLNDTVMIAYLPMSTIEYTNYTICVYSKKDSTYFYTDGYKTYLLGNDPTKDKSSYYYYYHIENESIIDKFTQINQVFLIDSVMLSQMKKDTPLTDKLFNLK